MKIAIVTGASSGMGREFVRQLGYFYKNLDCISITENGYPRDSEKQAE